MNLFAVNTLKEIAALICGTDGDGPVYRQYWEIRNFFAAAGWTDVPPFESGRGYGRNRWTYDLLLERQDDPEAIAQVIRRLADRREYPKSPDMPFVVCELLNKVLAVEDLRIEYSHGHPQLNAQGLPSSRVDAVIARAGLDEVGHRKAGGYSLGMRQRLGLAAEMLGDPPVLLLDEPSNGLDPEGIAWMRRYLRALAAEGRAVLVSSHLMSELEDTADHLIVAGRAALMLDQAAGMESRRIQERIVRVRDAVTGVSDGRPAAELAERVADMTGVPLRHSVLRASCCYL